MFFEYEIRESFLINPICGTIYAKNKADAFNQVVRIYSHQLKTDVTGLKISLREVS